MPNNTPAAIFAAREQERNMTGPMNFVVDPSVIFAPKHVLYIFNIGPMAHTVFKGSAGPVGGYKIEPCEKGEPYSRPLIIPSLVVDTYMVENEIKTHSVTGEFMCQDIVHPMIGRTWSVGQNLDDFGVFWTKNNPPKPEEIDKARGQMEKTFRAALTEATMLEATNNLKDITPIMRYAADYFQEDRPWNRLYRKTAECPACGGPTQPGRAIHTCGAVLDWPAAIRFGLKTKADAAAAGIELDARTPAPRDFHDGSNKARGMTDEGSQNAKPKRKR